MYGRYVYLGQKCWLRLRQQNCLVTEKILFMLEGAIIGIHEAALPVARRQELAEWADSLRRNRSFPVNLSNLALQTTNLWQ